MTSSCCKALWCGARVTFSKGDHFVYAPSQWETTFHFNVVPHRLGVYTAAAASLAPCFTSSSAAIILTFYDRYIPVFLEEGLQPPVPFTQSIPWLLMICHGARASAVMMKQAPGSCLNIKMSFPKYRITIMKIRHSHDCLICYNGNPHTWKYCLYIETGPRACMVRDNHATICALAWQLIFRNGCPLFINAC